MQQTTVMTLDERLAINMKAIQAYDQGNEEEYLRIMMQELPMLPYLAKWAKKRLGADFLIRNKWNLEEANAEFGPGWLDK